MPHYSMPYLSFSVISLIGVPISYLWNLLDWFLTDNLGLLEKRSESILNTIYLSAAVAGLLVLTSVADGVIKDLAEQFFRWRSSDIPAPRNEKV